MRNRKQVPLFNAQYCYKAEILQYFSHLTTMRGKPREMSSCHYDVTGPPKQPNPTAALPQDILLGERNIHCLSHLQLGLLLIIAESALTDKITHIHWGATIEIAHLNNLSLVQSPQQPGSEVVLTLKSVTTAIISYTTRQSLPFIILPTALTRLIWINNNLGMR